MSNISRSRLFKKSEGAYERCPKQKGNAKNYREKKGGFKEKKRKKIIIIVICIVLAIIATVAIYFLTRPKEVITEGNYKQIMDDMSDEVQEGYFETYMNTD